MEGNWQTGLQFGTNTFDWRDYIAIKTSPEGETKHTPLYNKILQNSQFMVKGFVPS